MGRAIVRKPKAFLMDEPLSNLDAKLRVQMRSEIARLHQRLGTSRARVPRGVSPEQRRAAVELATFLMSRDAQSTLAERNAWPSIREDAYGEVPAEQRETFQAVQNALENGWYRPNVVYWPDVSEQMNAAVRRILEGGENPRTVLNELHGRIEAAARQKGAQYPTT